MDQNENLTPPIDTPTPVEASVPAPEAPQEIPTPQEAPAPQASPEPAPAKKSKAVVWLLSFLLILTIAAAAVFAYFYFTGQTSQPAPQGGSSEITPTPDNPDTQEPEDDDSEVEEIINKIYEALADNFEYSPEKSTGDGSTIKIPNTDVYTKSNKSYDVILFDQNDTTNIMNKAHVYAESVLKDNGFVGEDGVILGYIGNSTMFYKSDSGIYCFESGASAPFRASCSKETWISDDSKDLVLSLAKTANQKYIAADPSNITDSSVIPYQRITASGLNAAMLFYRVSPDSEWQFFVGTQGVLLCSDYTDDVAKAFAGEICWDDSTNQQSTVQP